MFNVPTGATLLGTKMWVIDAASALIPGGQITVNVFATGWTTAVHGSELTLQRDECLLVLVRGPADPSRGHVRASEAGGPSTIATSDGDRQRLELRR
jgi:hypothetical protein